MRRGRSALRRRSTTCWRRFPSTTTPCYLRSSMPQGLGGADRPRRRPDGAEVLLTRRSMHLNSHRGEVSFPGGRLDPGETPVDPRAGEAHEEVGLDLACFAPIFGSAARPQRKVFDK